MKYGLPPETIDKIRSVFARFPAIEKAVLYGSRAKGNYKPGSDIDLTLYGAALTSNVCATIADALDDLLLPYKVDLSIFDELDHVKLREHIERVGVIFYEQIKADVSGTSGWKTKRLGDLCTIELGKTPPRGNPKFWDVSRASGNVWLSIADLLNAQGGVVDDSKEYISDAGAALCKRVKKGTLMVSFKLTLGRLAFAGQDLYTNEAIAALDIHNEKDLSKEFLRYFFLFFDWNKATEGDHKIKGRTLNKEKLKEVMVSFPALKEQQRIVVILDEVFDSISTAKANAEKNLKNSREIFDSYLDSVDAERVELGELVNITTGKLDANAAIEGGQYPFFTCSREVYAIDKHAFECEAILLAGNNAVGDFNVKHYKGRFNAYQRTYVITINEKRLIKYRFLYFQMLKSLSSFKKQSVGAGTKFLKLGMIKGMRVALPSLAEQEQIMSKMDNIKVETENLAAIYEQELAALDKLKKSLLHKAFNGKL